MISHFPRHFAIVPHVYYVGGMVGGGVACLAPACWLSLPQGLLIPNAASMTVTHGFFMPVRQNPFLLSGVLVNIKPLGEIIRAVRLRLEAPDALGVSFLKINGGQPMTSPLTTRHDSMLDDETKKELLNKLQALRPDADFIKSSISAWVDYAEERATFTGWWIADWNVGDGRGLMRTQSEKEFPRYFIGRNLDEAITNMILLAEVEAFAS